MNLNQLKKEFQPYINKYGFVSPPDGNADHNPLMHGWYLALLIRLGLLDQGERDRQARLYMSLVHPKYPGILLSAPHPHPNSNKHSHDNLRAMFWASKALGLPFAKDFLAHGRAYGWNWNPTAPDRFDVEGTYERFTGMIAQAQIAAGETPTCFRSTWMTGEILISAHTKREHSETVTLPYYMCKTIRGYSAPTDLAIQHWRNRTFAKYPGGLGEVLEEWGWGDHPCVRWYRGILDV